MKTQQICLMAEEERIQDEFRCQTWYATIIIIPILEGYSLGKCQKTHPVPSQNLQAVR